MPSPTIFSYTILDSKGVKATNIIYTAYDALTETVSALVGAAAAYGGDLNAVIDGQITDARVIIDIAPDPSWRTAPLANSNVEQTGLFNFRQANSKYLQPNDVPAISASVLIGGRIDLSNAAIAALIGAITGSTGLGGVSVNSKYSNDLTALNDALVTFRKHKRALDRVSYEIP
jgi:hypothetical protein